jgi:SAM-dependent methyltransferase
VRGVPVQPADLADARRRRRRQKLASIVANELIVDSLSAFLAEHFQERGAALLDLGAGSKPYSQIYEPYFERTVSLDVGHSPHGTEAVDVIASADDLPFEEGRFDCIICTEVLEHCRDPALVMSEIRRVLRPGGVALITTPFMKGLHEMPYDYYRYTPPALRDLADRAGLEVLALEHRGDMLAVGLSIASYPLTKALSRPGPWFYRYENPVVWLLLVAPQLAYLGYWRRARNGGRVSGRLTDRLSRSPLGFILTVQAP